MKLAKKRSVPISMHYAVVFFLSENENEKLNKYIHHVLHSLVEIRNSFIPHIEILFLTDIITMI